MSILSVPEKLDAGTEGRRGLRKVAQTLFLCVCATLSSILASRLKVTSLLKKAAGALVLVFTFRVGGRW